MAHKTELRGCRWLFLNCQEALGLAEVAGFLFVLAWFGLAGAQAPVSSSYVDQTYPATTSSSTLPSGAALASAPQTYTQGSAQVCRRGSKIAL
jgi:hypothetical protein